MSATSQTEPARAAPALDLDTKAAAAKLGVQPHTLEIWRSTGRYGVPYTKTGRLVRYSSRKLDEWIAARSFNDTTKD